MNFNALMTKISNKADSLYNSLLPKPAKEYGASTLSSFAYAVKDLTLSNLFPSLKLAGAFLKSAWANAKTLYTRLMHSENPTEEKLAAETAYLNGAYKEMDGAKKLAFDASAEMLTNLGNAGCHMGNGLLNGACLTAIGAIEAGKYLAPHVASALNFGLVKATDVYNQLPSITQVKSSIAAQYHLVGFNAYKALSSEKSIEMATIKAAALNL